MCMKNGNAINKKRTAPQKLKIKLILPLFFIIYNFAFVVPVFKPRFMPLHKPGPYRSKACFHAKTNVLEFIFLSIKFEV